MKEKNKDIINELLDNALPAFNNKTVSINTNNGILNENFLERQKSLFLKETLEYHRNKIIHIKQDYPYNDISDVHLASEFFILPRREYLQIKELLNNE